MYWQAEPTSGFVGAAGNGYDVVLWVCVQLAVDLCGALYADTIHWLAWAPFQILNHKGAKGRKEVNHR